MSPKMWDIVVIKSDPNPAYVGKRGRIEGVMKSHTTVSGKEIKQIMPYLVFFEERNLENRWFKESELEVIDEGLAQPADAAASKAV